MTKDQEVFSFANWKSPHMIFPFVVLILGGGLLLIAGFYGNNTVAVYLGVGILILFFGIFYFIFSIKIKVNEIGVGYSSIFKTAFINWNNVKTIGAYIATRYSNLDTNLTDIKNVSFWGQKFLFISTEVNASVNWGQKISGKLIYFHFRPELLDLITYHLKHGTQHTNENK